MPVFKTIDGAAALVAMDWTQKSVSKTRLTTLQQDINDNLTKYSQDLVRLQNLAKGKLDMLKGLLAKADSGALDANALQQLMPNIKQTKTDVKAISDEVKKLDQDYFAAHDNFRNGAFTNVPKPYNEQLGKIRTEQQNKVKEFSGKTAKVIHDYVDRASAACAQLGALSGQVTQWVDILKKVDSLLTKLKATVNTAVTDKGKTVNALKRIEDYISDKGRQKDAINSVSDVIKGEVKLKGNRKTVKELHDGIVKLLAGANFPLAARVKTAKIQETTDERLKMEDMCNEVKDAHVKAEAAVKKSKVKVANFPANPFA